MFLVFSAGVAIILAAIWSAILLIWASLLHPLELEDFLTRISHVREAPLYLSVVDVLLTNAGGIFWLTEDQDERIHLYLSLGVLGLYIFATLYGMAIGVQA
eukprot:TRINITY_DN12646_c4_g8_i1.p5 TRINITY_DN12646_c4_g8~~TRINITY_DN12646_c4_g8_i1.p5  ORF type:complete len:101 (-),score=7.64 TRINITY_DN12646_c4_g8_i1:1065-1367(-)